MNMLVISICLIIIIVILMQFLRNGENKRFNELLRQFPSYPAYPLIGNGYMLLGSMDGLLLRLHNIMKLNDRVLFWIGPVPCLFLKNYDDIVTVANHSQDRDSMNVIQNWLGIGLLSARYEDWKTSRRFMNQAFSPGMLSKYRRVFKKDAIQLVEKLKSVADSDREIDVFDLMMDSGLNSIVENTMGISIENGGDAEQRFCDATLKVIHVLVQCFQYPLLLSYHILWIYVRITGYLRDCQILKDLPSKLIKMKLKEIQDIQRKNNIEAVEDDGSSKTLIDLLVRRSTKEPDFTEERMVEEMLQLIMSGIETSGISLSFLSLMLAMNQDVQRKVYEEISQFLNNDRTNIEDHLNDLKYLEQCILETARMFNPVLFTSRRIHKDVLLKDNAIVPANLLVIPLMYFTNLDPILYENPLKWNPERFADEAVNQRPKNSQLCFGHGPRNCIGSKYAMTMLKIKISYILRDYHLSTSVKEITMQDLKADLLIRSKIGYPVKFTKRVNMKLL